MDDHKKFEFVRGGLTHEAELAKSETEIERIVKAISNLGIEINPALKGDEALKDAVVKLNSLKVPPAAVSNEKWDLAAKAAQARNLTAYELADLDKQLSSEESARVDVFNASDIASYASTHDGELPPGYTGSQSQSTYLKNQPKKKKNDNYDEAQSQAFSQIKSQARRRSTYYFKDLASRGKIQASRAANWAWKGIGQLGGAVVGGVNGFIGSFTGGLGLLLVAAVAIIEILAILYLLTAFVVVIFIFIIQSGAYVIPPADPLPGAGSNSGTYEGGVKTSLYIDITKTANPAGPFENSDLPLTIEYTVTISAKRGSLSNIQFTNECEVFNKSGTFNCNGQLPPEEEMPGTIDPGEPYIFTYTNTYENPGVGGGLSFDNSIVSDTFTVIADAAGATNEEASAFASIIIGDPPADCPSGWPVLPSSSITIGQGPWGGFSHVEKKIEPNKSLGYGWEAIDAGASTGTSVVATHNGKLEIYLCPATGCVNYGLHVRIEGICNGKAFESVYAHMSFIDGSLVNGQQVTKETFLGKTGATGFTNGQPHIHYEFRPQTNGNISGSYPEFSVPPVMSSTPYVPEPVPRECDNFQCGVSIP